jgi:hypothetical protein
MDKQQNWKKYLPSSHFMTIVIVIGVIVGLFLGVKAIIHHYKNKVFVTATGIPANMKVGDLLTVDTDSDGVADWEEPLWGLDPKKADTNGDGISDGTEVTQKKSTLAGTEEENVPEKLNDTERFSRDLFTTLSALSQSGALTEQSVVNLSNTLGDQIVSKDMPSKYTDVDLNVVASSKTTISAYYKNISKVINAYTPDKIGGEMDVMVSMFDKADPEKAKELGIIAENYISFATDIMKIAVPADIAPKQLALANSAEKMGRSLTAVKDVFENPIISMGGFIAYTKESQNFTTQSDVLHAYFVKNGILK